MRLFAGIPLDDAARAYVADAAEQLLRAGAALKWVRSENWHVTLAFLGAVAQSRVIAARETFVRTASTCKSFALRLAMIGAFPSLHRPRAIYVGGDPQPDAFARTVDALRAEFTSLGFHFDDDAIAHVTIGRSNGRLPIDAPTLSTAIDMPVRRLVLFASVPTAGSVRYDEIESVDLRNA